MHSLGFNMNWASFHVVELMSTQNVKYKRVGYLAATQSFGDDTDVVLLIPNLLKKDLASPNPAEAALAIGRRFPDEGGALTARRAGPPVA